MFGTDDFTGLVAFILVIVIGAVGWRVIKLFEPKERLPKDSGFKMQKGYGINYMMRRRRLNLYNPNSSFRTSIGKKFKKQVQGIFKRRRYK